jgi:hypothetical protein
MRESIQNEFELFDGIEINCKFLIKGGNSPLILSLSYKDAPDLIVFSST